jgi:hypothetical protein
VEIQLHALLTSAPDGGEWLASRTGQFIPTETVTWYPLCKGLGGPTVALDAVAKKKFLPLPGIEPPLPSPLLIFVLTELEKVN